MFKNIFGKSKESKPKEDITPKINWLPIKNLTQVAELEKISHKTPIGIFKHSTRCSISTTVLKRFEQNFPKETELTMFYIDLLNYREVSSEVGYKFQVMHQSPQLILVNQGKVIAHASHYDILQVDLNI